MPAYIWQIKLMLICCFHGFCGFFFGFDNNLVTIYLTADWLLHIWNSFTAAPSSRWKRTWPSRTITSHIYWQHVLRKKRSNRVKAVNRPLICRQFFAGPSCPHPFINFEMQLKHDQRTEKSVMRSSWRVNEGTQLDFFQIAKIWGISDEYSIQWFYILLTRTLQRRQFNFSCSHKMNDVITQKLWLQ